jgi:hypothetical protein
MTTFRAWRLYFDKAYSANVTVTKIELRQTPGGADYTNTSPSGSAIASGFFDNTFQPRYAFDNSASEWASPNSSADNIGHWIGWDAGSGNSFDVNEIVVKVRSSNTLTVIQNQMFREARIEASNNLYVWYPIWHITDFNAVSASGEVRAYTRPSLSGSAPYWRVYATSVFSGGGTEFTISEAEFRGTIGGVDLTQSGSGLSSASSNLSNLVGLSEQAFDNTTSSAWSSPSVTAPHWLSYHFTSSVSIKQVVMVARTDFVNGAPRDFQIHASDNPTTWQFVESFTSSSWVAGATGSVPITIYDQSALLAKLQTQVALGGRDDAISVTKIGTEALFGGYGDRVTIAKVSPEILWGGTPDRVNIGKIAPEILWGGNPDRVNIAKIAVGVLIGLRTKGANGPVQIF